MTKLDSTRFLVLGEGLAAGMTNFSLFEDDQLDSFPAQLARQLKVEFPQALIQPPGIGDAPGFPRLPVMLPYDHQTTVLREFPAPRPSSNLSVPGLALADALSRRPLQPIVHGNDALQTGINLILGMPQILLGGRTPLPTLLECAIERKPTFAVVELGFAEVLNAAVAGDPGSIPDAAGFRSDFSRLLTALREIGCQVIVMTIPDPIDTAHFSTAEAASEVVKLSPSGIRARHGLRGEDRVTVNGLSEIGYQVITGRIEPLPKGFVLRGEHASEISSRVQALNETLAALAREKGAVLYDLCGFIRRLRQEGVPIAGRRLTAGFLGGFYSLNGYYPGKTGHALIANELIGLINRTFDAHYETLDVAKTIQSDPVAAYRVPEGPAHDTMAGRLAAGGAALKRLSMMAGFVVQLVKGSMRRQKPPERPSSGSTPELWKLKLPPSLEQELPLNKESSYYGDCLRPVHTADPDEAFFGLTGKLLFGGMSLLDSHLSGSVHIKFAPPVDNVTHFEVTHGRGLVGDDGRLSSPQFFILPALHHQVMDSTEVRSSGDLNLITGEVTNLRYKLYFMNSAILSLANVNPTLPRDPLNFPGEYGSTWAKFEQRPDGKLDYTFFGTTFIPLSVLKTPIRYPLCFMSPAGDYASIPSDGTALHPHIRLSTKPPEGSDPGAECPEIPFNAIREFTASIHNNSFGDDFSLNAAELGGPANGRAHLVGRFWVQFGERFGDDVSVAITAMPNGGSLAVLPQSPLAAAFKHRIPDSLIGHREFLRFPKQTYSMDTISYLDDALEVAQCAVNLKTGKVLGHLLRRGIITTNWLLAMIRLEERIPKNTFSFRGPASFEKGVNGQMVFRYKGDLHLPFPEGFKFPAPDLNSTFIIGPNSALDPFVRFQAMCVPGSPRIVKSGGADRLVASTGEEFSYTFSLPEEAAAARFEYTNHTKGATFRMQCLSWLRFMNSRTASVVEGDFDTVTFSGFGTWSGDPAGGLHLASVQVSTSKQFPYISILIDGGHTSDVNTKPQNVGDTMP